MRRVLPAEKLAVSSTFLVPVVVERKRGGYNTAVGPAGGVKTDAVLPVVNALPQIRSE